MSYVWPTSLPACSSGMTSRPHLAVSDEHGDREESIDDDAKKEPKAKRVTQEGVYRSIDPVDKAARTGRRL